MSASALLAIIAPQLDTVANRDAYLEMAELQVNRCLFGTKADMAVAYMAAHMMTLNTDPTRQGGGGAGQVTSKREGDLAITYAQASGGSSAGADDLALTIYGSQFQRLLNSVTAAVHVTGVEDWCE